MSKNRIQDIRTRVPQIASTITETAIVSKMSEKTLALPAAPQFEVTNYQMHLSKVDFNLLVFIVDGNDNDILLAAMQVEQHLWKPITL